MLNKIPKRKKRILILATCLFGLVIVMFLSLHKVDKSNSVIVKGDFGSIEKIVTKGDVSYNLYLTDGASYRIAADDAECFMYDQFTNDIKPGQLINMLVCKGNFFSSSFVADIYTTSYHYLNVDCVNTQIENDRTYLPVYCAVGYIISVLVIIFKKEL